MSKRTGVNQKSVVIAGATGNVGGASVKAFAKRGYRVIMLGRSEEKLAHRAKATSAELREQDPSFAGEILTLEIDFADLESVEKVAKRISVQFDAIDVLILSVVTLKDDGPTLLPNGNELMFSTNVLGPFLFATLLKPSIEAAQGVIVHVVAPFHQDIDWDDLQSIKSYKSMVAYERTKTCNRIIAGEMARRYADGCVSVAFDPGFVIDRKDPDLEKRWPSGLVGMFWWLYASVSAKSPTVAGQALADLVTQSSDRKSINGAYYKLTKRLEKPETSMNDLELGSRLWEALEALTVPDPAKRAPFTTTG